MGGQTHGWREGGKGAWRVTGSDDDGQMRGRISMDKAREIKHSKTQLESAKSARALSGGASGTASVHLRPTSCLQHLKETEGQMKLVPTSSANI